MRKETNACRLGRLLREWRGKRRTSRRVLAEFAGVSHTSFARAERGADARVSTWERLFEALGCRLVLTVEEADGADDCEDYLLHETDRRLGRRLSSIA